MKQSVRNRLTNKGSILILVLWAIFFLGAFGIAIRSYVQPQLSLAQKLIGRAKMYYLANAGIKRAILEVKNDSVEDIDEDGEAEEEKPVDYDALNESWCNNEKAFGNIQADGGTFSVVNIMSVDSKGKPLKKPIIVYGLTDEERKININKATQAVLANFFEITAGLDKDDAALIAASIEDWRDEDDELRLEGAEGEDYYEKLEAPYPCKNSDFEVLEELLMVRGMTSEIFESVKDKITVYGSGAVNINTAGTAVLEGLGMDEKLAEKIIHFRAGSDGVEGTEDDNIFTDSSTIMKDLSEKEHVTQSDNSLALSLVADGLLSVRSDNFAGHARGSVNGRQGFLEIIFIYDRANNVIKYWDEINTG